ncbi:transposase [Geobacter chapellei]|uniref:Transposase n=2 Tax=Pelotalea chapellei TaxID=44671 RepID=A0ABS5UAU4_9BACT|nr:transposase [Pelotalea chapellei]
MPYNSAIHHRRSIRLRAFDYRSNGTYFITICAFQRESLFGEVVDGDMRLNRLGMAVDACWQSIANHFPNVQLDEFVIMPNHFHGIMNIVGHVGAKQGSSASPGFGIEGNNVGNCNKGEAGEAIASPLRDGTVSGSLGAVIQNFKSISTRKINKIRNNPGCPVWQRNYYEHIIRSESDLTNIRQYIANNPLKWDMDDNNLVNVP